LETLLRELASAGVREVVLVTGYRAEQVEAVAGAASAFGLGIRTVHQPRPEGAADAIRRAAAEPPYLVTAADTVYRSGDVARFAAVTADAGAGAISVRRQPGRPRETRIRVHGGRVARVVDPSSTDELTAAPLVLVGDAVHQRIAEVTQPPYKPPYDSGQAFQLAIDAGHEVGAVEIGPTRDLTRPIDLLHENFEYLHDL
jgi:NDP-sugar pyrophosphorylase family protein